MSVKIYKVKSEKLPSEKMTMIPRTNFLTHATLAAPYLLGKVLVRRYQGQFLAGVVTETEAYQGEKDLGCHAKAGLTPRTRVMYGPPGRAYIYFTYGMHWMLNTVTGMEGEPAAVLIRSVFPIYGQDIMGELRPTGKPNQGVISQKGWTDGPAKLCQAFSLSGSMNGCDLCEPDGELRIMDAGIRIPSDQITNTSRIGLFSVPEPWKSIPWRWLVSAEWLAQQDWTELAALFPDPGITGSSDNR